MRAHHAQTIRLGKSPHGGVVGLRRAEARGELRSAEELMEVGAGGIIKLGKQCIQVGLIP